MNDPLRSADEATGGRPFTLRARTASRTAGSSHAQRFRLATGMLVGIAIGAIVVAGAVLVGASSSDSGQKWSRWAPSQGGLQGARQIADHFAPLYRINGVDQLAIVTVSSLNGPSGSSTSSAASSSASGSSGLQVAVRPDPSSSAVSLIGGSTIAYNLCGIGSSNCSIGVGTPSADRLLLLRREALELALYSFKYLNGIQNVVAVLPPTRTVPTGRLSANPPAAGAVSRSSGTPVAYALLFLHDELNPWLSQPISSTLPLEFPPMVSELKLWRQTTEAALVAQITERGLFSERLTSTQDGASLIVLDAIPPQ